MLIRYTGPKPSKRVELQDGDYTFDPTCEVTNPEHIRWLLKPDHKGLFEVYVPPPAQTTQEPPASQPSGSGKKSGKKGNK